MAVGIRPTAPLAGRTVLVSRPEGKVEDLAVPLEALGAEVARLPALAIVPPRDPEPLRRAVRRLARFDWVVLTSPRGVRALRDALDEQGGGVAPARVAAVGSSTAAACRQAGWEAALVPERFDADGLLEAFDARGGALVGLDVLLPLAEAARDVLADGLTARGARVERVVAYRSRLPDELSVEPIRRILGEGRVDLLTFTSPSTAENVLEAVGEAVLAVPAAVIGSVTAEAARELGYEVVAVADPHTIEGLVEAVLRVLAPRRRGG